MSDVLNQLIEAARQLSATGLVTGAGGNVSVRDGAGMWISPSGFAFADAVADDYPLVDVDSGEILQGDRRPSSEVFMHFYIYRQRPDVQAVIHTHPRMTISLSSAGHDLRPMFADYYVYLGQDVPHLDYVTVTTPELARAVEAHFVRPSVKGMVLRNHGAITIGASIKEAVYRTESIEEQATIQWQAQLVGDPVFLSDEECRKLDQLGSEDYRRQLLASMKAK